jgi:hypothetical protein
MLWAMASFPEIEMVFSSKSKKGMRLSRKAKSINIFFILYSGLGFCYGIPFPLSISKKSIGTAMLRFKNLFPHNDG